MLIAYNVLLRSVKSAQVETVVRIKVADVAAEIAQAHGIQQELVAVTVEGETLVLKYGGASGPQKPVGQGFTAELLRAPETTHVESNEKPVVRLRPRRRRPGKRNRMRTRGWNIVTKFQNSHGQTVAIYEPFVKALLGMAGPRRAREKAVAEILKANGNRPGPDSVKYYLENTLEYLAKEAVR